MSVAFDDLMALLKVLTVEQAQALAESLPIPRWVPGTVMSECLPGGSAEVLLDRDAASGAQVLAVNLTGQLLLAGARVSVRAAGQVLEVDSLVDAGFPPGVLLPYGGTTEPAWGVFANGQTLPTDPPYHRLAHALGLDTGSTFVVPNADNRTIVFKGSSFSTLLAVGGAMSRTIAKANLPSYNLDVTVNDPGHVHDIGSGSNVSATGAVRQEPGSSGTATSGSKTTGITVTVGSGGSGTALDTTPAHIVLNGVWTL